MQTQEHTGGVPGDQALRRGRPAPLSSLQDEDELVLAATTRTEILVGPERTGGDAPESASAFVAGCATIPVTAAIADAAAVLKARRNALSVPDAVALAVADTVGADAVWTFDQRWVGVDSRVMVPAGVEP